MYNVPPDFDIFSVFFLYLERQRKILYIVGLFISLTSRICNREVAGSNLSLGYFAPRSIQPSIPRGR